MRRASVFQQGKPKMLTIEGLIFKKIAKMAENYAPNILALRELDCMKRLVAHFVRNKLTVKSDRREMRAVIFKCIEVYKKTQVSNQADGDSNSTAGKGESPLRKRKGKKPFRKKKKSSKTDII